ncbi:MAG: helix-turn-helix domain-containing protein [Chloroflexi bacterium]|nr:helix-turn-helix domain-containing protein [Chloroflexota bacterium]
MSKLAERRQAQQAKATPIPAHLRRISEVSAMTGIPNRTLREWAADDRIEAHRHGPKLWYINLKDAQRVAQTLKPGPKPKK